MTIWCKMKRVRLLEIHEQSWCPTAIRHGVRDGLFTIWKLFFWKNALPHLQDLLSHSKSPRLVDLCSGGGGPVPLVLEELNRSHPEIEVLLTDWYPKSNWVNPMGQNDSLTYHRQSVDAKNVPEHLGDCRTLFEAFHHFSPAEAQGILADAVRSQKPIAIFEFQRASFWKCLTSFPLNIAVLFGAYGQLWHTQFSWKKLLFTLIPIIPAILVIDGLVSVWRTYSTSELAQLAKRAGADNFRWEVRQSEDCGWGIMTCLIGWPDADGGVFLIPYPSGVSTAQSPQRTQPRLSASK